MPLFSSSKLTTTYCQVLLVIHGTHIAFTDFCGHGEHLCAEAPATWQFTVCTMWKEQAIWKLCGVNLVTRNVKISRLYLNSQQIFTLLGLTIFTFHKGSTDNQNGMQYPVMKTCVTEYNCYIKHTWHTKTIQALHNHYCNQTLHMYTRFTIHLFATFFLKFWMYVTLIKTQECFETYNVSMGEFSQCLVHGWQCVYICVFTYWEGNTSTIHYKRESLLIFWKLCSNWHIPLVKCHVCPNKTLLYQFEQRHSPLCSIHKRIYKCTSTTH